MLEPLLVPFPVAHRSFAPITTGRTVTMLRLLQVLQDRDSGFLRIIAEQWGVDLPSGSSPEIAPRLAQAMLEEKLVREVVEALPSTTRYALEYILARGGRKPVAELARRFGPLPEVGPGRRDREKPWRNPSNPLEDLWYRGFVARAYEDTATGLAEFAYVPTDLAGQIPSAGAQTGLPQCELPQIPPWISPATHAIVDDATTCMAFLRLPLSPLQSLTEGAARRLRAFLYHPEALDLLVTLLLQQGVLSSTPLRPAPQPTRSFLAAPRISAAGGLLQSWQHSTSWNDLANIPHLEVAGGSWPNDPLSGRSAIVDLLSEIPAEKWWSIESFVLRVREEHPGFQRPGGDFDSWYLSDKRTGTYLRGYENWDLVEGALIRYLICGPLHWLGAVDLGASEAGQPATSFRITRFGSILWDTDSLPESTQVEEHAKLQTDGRLRVPRLASRTLRYQLSRFTSWEKLTPEGYSYLLTPSALERGTRQGLRMHHVRGVLEAVCGIPLPPSVDKALKRWEKKGTEARIRREWVLLVTEPKILSELRAHRATARYLDKNLGPGVVRMRERDWEALRAGAARLGILIDPPVREATARESDWAG